MCQIWQKFLRVSPANLLMFLVWSSGAVAADESTPAIVGQHPLSETLTGELQPELESNENLADPTADLLEQINQYNNETEADTPLPQINSVSQLSDVQPEDWAYEALRSLVERYGVIAGYPNGTFQGNRSMTRYEFAAALSSALDRIQSLIVSRRDAVPPADLTVLEQLTDEFILELSLLRGDVDALTARTAELELTQFSTTTKLNGEVILGVAGIVAGDDAQGNDIDDVTVLGHRTRLNLETSFTGRDLLRTRLQAEGLGALKKRTLTPEGELAFTGATDSDLEINALLYSFPIGSRTQVVVAANGGAADNFTDTINPFFDGDGASGAVSRFGTRPSIYYLVSGAGVGVRHTLSDNLEVSLGYLAGDAGNPSPGAGLFDGSYGAIAQVTFQPSDRASIGLTYVNAYNQDFQTGSNDANLFNRLGLPVATHSYGIAGSVQISPRFILGGWAGYTTARVIDEGDASIWNWAVTLAFPDLGKTGNLAGAIIGMEPKVTDRDDRLNELGIDDSSTSFHLEAFYQYQLTDNITITPGIIWLTALDHDSANEDVVIGTLRTTFRF
ncbi:MULTISPECIES: iron uptake porin [unclassified Coleofasciculus]|uniref:iron uptake porin n=1 Tax=unclassified Coleofasciculus TaxID=2692782 RepID=UPI00187F836B|nr:MULTISPECIES: iron uptake porin [unclassified Coleofasciculus]MBE9129876.1 carbohydrate porin [Coleofasciculus sp. LEGE 07081]MBE9152330.1 carbohydrate porin [Coleofasciculus sp. LEGE 07092]